MILKSLAEYYEALAARGDAPRRGWGKTKVSFALELSAEGTLVRVVPLLSPSANGKKMMPREMELPAPVKRANDIVPNFLWDNATYLLGFDEKGKPERTMRCFEAAKKLHQTLLNASDDPFALAIKRFFAQWEPANEGHPALAEYLEDIKKGVNLAFRFEGADPKDCAALRNAWQAYYDNEEAGEKMPCLITGEMVVPCLTHPAIKGVRGAQSSGAALVSFNAPAFCSYERTQNLNAPVGKYTAFAYTTALNTLLADAEHVRCFGDTTVVFWANEAEKAYQDAFGDMLDGGGDALSNTELRDFMDALSNGRQAAWDQINLSPETSFSILGLAPNAARLSVRFFLRDTFGDFVKNVKRHYENLELVGDGQTKFSVLPLWALLRETVNLKTKDKSPCPQMAGDTLRAILSGGRYPATLYDQTLLRIHAERSVTWGRASVIKAYLLRNLDKKEYKEAATVALNEKCEQVPYVLGRLFSLLEYIQDSATGASTVKDRFFSAASTTPAAAFPMLLRLENSHMKVLMRDKPGLGVKLSKQLTELMGRLGNEFPAHLLLAQQGEFILGYYHQTQKRYEKKDAENVAETPKEEKENV